MVRNKLWLQAYCSWPRQAKAVENFEVNVLRKQYDTAEETANYLQVIRPTEDQ